MRAYLSRRKKEESSRSAAFFDSYFLIKVVSLSSKWPAKGERKKRFTALASQHAHIHEEEEEYISKKTDPFLFLKLLLLRGG